MAKGKGKQRVAEKSSKCRQSFQPRSILHSRARLFEGSHSFFKRQFIRSSPAGAILTWLKRIFRIVVVVLKNQEKARRDLKRIASKVDRITKQIEASSGTKYVPPPEMEIESTDEEEEELRQFIHSSPAGSELTWVKRIFRNLVVILKSQEKDMRDPKRIASKQDRINKQMEAYLGAKYVPPPEVEIEASAGTKYVPPPEMEIESTDEEEEEEELRQFIHSSPAGAKLTWLKRIFRNQVVILKNQEKDMRDLKRIASKQDWITKQMEAYLGAKYVPPPEVEIESTDEEEEELDSDDE